MKTRLPLLALCAALATQDAIAAPEGRNLTPQGILADLVLLRPFGLAITAMGAGLFLGTSPLAAIADFAATPHDALQRSGEALVLAPAAFTFTRPLGEFSYQLNGVYPVR
jgi:hypothetical protein